MRLVGWLTGASVVAWMVAALMGSPALEVLLGMAGPLVVESGSWILTERTYRRAPDRLTRVMIAAFSAKLVLFAAYLAVMLKGLPLRPLPFVVSFTFYFIALHLVQAWSLQRLFAGDVRASR